jgi:hypothetical protein
LPSGWCGPPLERRTDDMTAMFDPYYIRGIPRAD